MVEEYQAKLKNTKLNLLLLLTHKRRRSKEVQDMQKRIVDFRDNAQKNYNKKESDIVNH
jgi:outer membrane protein